ncbi:MAG: hypothetical protein GXO33_01745 [Epsilonproteobacteria bacterium]|nr:hypothetical protein [Campylobacterota bacterium]
MIVNKKAATALFMLTTLELFAAAVKSGEALARMLHLSAGSKAMIQWERVFKSERKMKRYGIDRLSEEEKKRLKRYLINHAVDSDQPTVAGEY